METNLDIDTQVELGGRRFIPTPDDEIVFEQFAYIQQAASDAGLVTELIEAYKPFIDEVTGKGEQISEEQIAMISEKVIMRAFRGRAYLRVLAGVLVEEGKEWTEEGAKANEEFFRRLKGPEIRVMHQILTMAIIGFFTSGLRSLGTSQSSLDRQSRLEAAGIDVGNVSLRPKVSPVTTFDGAVGMETSERS